MPKINYAFREITCKIVYYGPGLGGKTTNLQFVHGTVPDKHRGELVSLATEQDRTLFFDFLPLDIGEVKGFKTKFQLYTVPGQVFYNATRKLVLRDADGLVFVADSQATRRQDNIDSLNNLIDNLRDAGLSLEQFPFVMQYNKRDLPDLLTIEELQRTLNPEGKWQWFDAVATEGSGVRETLREVSSQVLKKLNATANIVSDEELVGERLGLITPADQAASEEAAAGAQGSQDVPDITINQRSKLVWHGMKISSGSVELNNAKADAQGADYTLRVYHKLLGLRRRSFQRTVRYVGEDQRLVEGQERTYYVFRDISATRKMAPVSVFVEKTNRPRVYLVYPGMGGEIKVGPVDEPVVV